jgi:hypothetical protein
VAAKAFASILDTGEEKAGMGAGGGTPVDGHLYPGDDGAAHTVGESPACCPLGIATHVDESIHGGVGLGTRDGCGVKEVQSAWPPARL